MKKQSLKKAPRYYLNENNEFVIENYNFSKPFANFFPGIAGKYGIPIWVFYVNRGQGIVSFGVKDKDHAILEFWPANKAWQFVSTHGFRTFIKMESGGKSRFYEPFHNGFVNLEYSLDNRMRIASHELTLEETNATLGLNATVSYFTIPLDSYAGLCRILTIRNTGRTEKKLSVIDGLPQIVPFGANDFFLKKMSRTIEAWINVENVPECAPFYKLTVDPSDRPEVVHIDQGNFYAGFHLEGTKTKRIKPIINPDTVFAPVTDFSCPYAFLKQQKRTLSAREILRSATPCAFLPLEFSLKPGEEKSLYVITGYARSIMMLNALLPRIISADYLAHKRTENKEIIEEIGGGITTKSSSRHFNLYARQTYLDNVMRGGYPVVFDCGKVFHLYARKHGDLERDYNAFSLQPSYFSQGNGNYRDANQNRRCDVWFNPRVNDENVVAFFNLLQLDGFNPLIVKGANFHLTDADGLRKALSPVLKEADIHPLVTFLSTPFTPGDCIFYLEDNKIKLNAAPDEFLNLILSCSEKIYEAEHGEGFWTDHWTYNIDLIESYLGVYPEKEREIFFEKRSFTWFDNIETVRPRSEKYVLYGGIPRQLHSVYADPDKRRMIHQRETAPHLVRTAYGGGGVYQTTLINKLLCLMSNKLASLDPFGIGIEMEANKPNWFDSLNGLPGLFGSSLCETMELKRLMLVIRKALLRAGLTHIRVTEEICRFLRQLSALLREYGISQADNRDFVYWDASAALKEEFRTQTKMGVSGAEIEMTVVELEDFLTMALNKVHAGIAKAKAGSKKLYSSYFMHEVTDYEKTDEHHIRARAFKQIRLPLFLEGQMHALRLAESTTQAKSLHNAVRSSPLFDKKLKMYKVTAPLASMPEEIGRCRIFAPGWLENESIWLHMEYKYILEMLKQGLYKDFFAEFRNVLIPFQPAARYGRSILENSSFIVSSAFTDAKLHGNGYVARLSGSTAEFLQMWLIMSAGIRPFFLDDAGRLNLRFAPILPGWLFDAKTKTYRFNFLGCVEIVYHNPARADTFGRRAPGAARILFDDASAAPVHITGAVIPAPYAADVRALRIRKIDVYLE